MPTSIAGLRLDIYEALEERSYRTIQDLACCLDSGTPATQAQVRAVLYAEPEVFYQMDDWWDLSIFHRFDGQMFRGKGRGSFDERKFLGRVLVEALGAKGQPVELRRFAEKYLLKIRNRIRPHKGEFPSGSGEIIQRLRRFLKGHPEFHLLQEDSAEYVWTAAKWPELPAAAPIQPPAYQLPAAFLDRAADYLSKCRGQPVRLLTFLKELLGIEASDVHFAAAFAQANKALSTDDETFAQVQEQVWMLVADLPDTIADIPARVAIPRWRNPTEEQLVGELYERLPVDSLAEAADFAAQDVEDEASAQFDESFLLPLKIILPYHWRQNGVLKVNAGERRLFPDRPARAYLQFTDQTGETFPVWLNNDTGYLLGLQDWYASYLVPAGGIFYIERSPGSPYNFKIRIKEATAHTFDGRQYLCEVDGDTYIEEDRLRDLEALRAKVEAAAATIKDVMCDLFESCPPDASLHYKQVWAQVHVIRPTTRRTVAAILSAFPCFYQVEAGSGYWRYAPGSRNAPPKYQARRAPKPAPARKPVPVQARPPRYWLAPVHAASWDRLVRPAGVGGGVFLAPWRGRSRVARGDGLAFFDTETERVVAAAEALKEPIVDAATGRRELTVKPALSAFNPIPYADLAGALSVPRPTSRRSPVWITREDWQILLERLGLSAVSGPTESQLESRSEREPPELEQSEPDTVPVNTQGAETMPIPSITSSIAFEFLRSQVESHLLKLQTDITEAAQRGAFDKVGALARNAQESDDLRKELGALEKRYKCLIEGEERDEASVEDQRIPRGQKTPKGIKRIPRGLKTSQGAYRIPILQALVDLGGRGEIHLVLEHVYELMKGRLNEHDLAPLASDGVTPRWRNTAQWTRSSLCEQGLIRHDSPRAVWEISEKGRAWLAEQKSSGKN